MSAGSGCTMASAMLSRRDIEALKDFVSAPGNFGQNQAESTVRLQATHSNLKAEFIELRLDLHVRPLLPIHSTSFCSIPQEMIVLCN